jgi:hypothetical protein
LLPTKLGLIINLKSANALCSKFVQILPALADDVMNSGSHAK